MQKYHLHKDTPTALQFALFPLGEYLAKNGVHTQRAHTHSFYQILWFTKGTGKHFVDFKAYKVAPQQLFFIGKGQIHAFDRQPYEGFIIHFNEIFLADNTDVINTFLKHNVFDSFSQLPYLQLSEAEVPVIENLFHQLQTEMQVPDSFAHSEYLKHLLHLLLISAQRFTLKANRPQLSISNPKHLLFVRFREAIEQHFKEEHQVAAYAEMLNVSAKTLTNCTNELVQQTPLEIINERLSLEAKRLLTHSDKPVSEIAYTLGFEDPSYFIRFFKRLNGIVPTKFR
ncbi:AraC family transcriptional regulator [Capnocytophaga sp. HP1101]